MSLMSMYTNQRVTLEKFIEDDNEGMPVFGAPEDIKCRKQPIRSFERTTFADSVAPKSVIYTETEVAAGDRLDGHIVIDVSEMVNLSGEVVGYKAVI